MGYGATGVVARDPPGEQRPQGEGFAVKHDKAAQVYNMLSDVSACHAADDSVRWRCTECCMGILHMDTAEASQATVRLHSRWRLQHERRLDSMEVARRGRSRKESRCGLRAVRLAPDDISSQHIIERGLWA